MQHFNAAELGPEYFEPLQRFFYAELEDLRRLQRLREAEHAGYVLEDLTRIWEPRICAAEPGTARLFAAESKNSRRTHRVSAAELEALGERYSVPMAVCYDQVLKAGAENLLVSGVA